MTEAQSKFVALEKKKAEYKLYLEQLEAITKAVAKEVGLNGMFQDNEGTVYKIVIPEGRFVKYETIGYKRTRRPGERAGDLSIKEASDAGYVPR